MKSRLITLFFVCLFTIANTFAANRYWVAATTPANWADATSWSETSGGAPGSTAPTTGDDVFFETGVATTVTLGAAITVNSITFTSRNVTFAGAFIITTTNMTVDNSQIVFVNGVFINSSLTFSGTTTVPRITHSTAGTFQLGNGNAFTLTGNSTTNYFAGGANSSFRYNTTSALTVFFKASTSLGGIYVYKGLITLGNDLTIIRLNFPPANLNNQELIVGSNVTLTLNAGGSSGFTELANGGTVNASAAGSKFVIKSTSTTVLLGTTRIFKTGTPINHLEFNSAGTTPETSTLVLFEPIRVRTLTLTAGTINNTTNSITIEPGGGGVVTVLGSTTAAVIMGVPATRYWVGGLAGDWSNPANWGTASGSKDTPGVPGFGDTIIFDAATGNENPTVTLNQSIAAESMLFTNSNVTFVGAYAITTNSMTVTNCQPTFVNAVTINSALTMDGALARISHLPPGSTIYRFTLGNGNAFTLTGNSAANYFEGNGVSNFAFNTTSAQKVYFNNAITPLAVIQIDKGLITLGNDVVSVRINLLSANNQELILGENVTLTLAAGGSSNLSSAVGGGVINASAAGSKFIILTASATFLNAGTKRIFKDATNIEHLELNSTGNTFILGYPLTVKNLTLTAGAIDNTTNNIIIPFGGNLVVGTGTTTVDLDASLPSAPTNVVATAGNAQASVVFTAPANGGSAIVSYTVRAFPGGRVVTGSTSPIVITGLTNETAYTFTVTAQNDLGDGDASQVSNQVTPNLNSAIQSITDDKMTVFNFNNGTITLNYNSDNSGNAIFKLLNLNGQVLLTRTLSTVAGKNTNSIAIDNLPAGMYIVYLSDGVNSLTDKIIKK
jgi:hypothetical protein